MHHWNYYVPDDQYRLLREAADRAGVSAAEIVRKMTERCLYSGTIDELVPRASGVLSASGRVF